MKISLDQLPDSAKKLISPEDQIALGMVQTQKEPEPQVSKFELKNERELQRLLLNLLSLKGYIAMCPRMDKKSSINEGWPDITFAVNGQACAWEVKTPQGRVRPEQAQCMEKMRLNGWKVEVIRSVDQARNFLIDVAGIQR